MTHPALFDRFQRAHTYLRISLTDRCNLRCTYCMPEHMTWARPAHLLTTDEILRLGRLFVDMGVTKIRLTGGEPTLHKDIVSIVSGLSALDGLGTLAMTTNAVKLSPIAAALRQSGLTTLTISLDTLRRDRFESITRRDRLDDVLKGVDAALEAGFAPVKINIVVMAGVNDDEILDFVDWASNRLIDLRFIEYMPFPGTDWSQGGIVPYKVIREKIGQKYSLIPLHGDSSSVGKSWAVEGYPVTVSFISSMTDSFCATCNRIRLTADGNIKACLFHPEEKSLRDVMREGGNDDDLKTVIRHSLQGKPQAHVPMEELLAVGNRSMISIGG